LLKRALRGSIDLMGPAMKIQKELMSMPPFGGADDKGLLATEMKYIRNLKKLFLAVMGATVQKMMQALESEQEILMNLADILAEIYMCESVVLATQKAAIVRGEDAVKDHIAMAQVYVNDAIERAGFHAKNAVAAWAEGDEKRMLFMAIKRYTKHEFINTKALRRQIADTLLAANEYCYK